MLTLKAYLQESTTEGKNLHLEHIEDEMFNRGVVGARDAILFLRSIRDMLAGHSTKTVTLTTKFDGAPAIFAGVNPENGKFFVGTKSVFAKLSPKLNYTVQDIDKNHGTSPGLSAVLKIALEHLPKLGITGVWQGDVMFTRDTLKRITMEDGAYLMFQPNTIVYTVPLESSLSRSMQRAHIGIVWHTQYRGNNMSDMKASFLPNLNELNVTPDVWYRDATFVDASGDATFSEAETKEITAILAAAGAIFSRIDPRLLNYIAQNNTIKNQIKVFNNSHYRQGLPFPHDPHTHVLQLTKWVTEQANKSILDAQQAPTKVKRQFEKTELLRFYNNNYHGLSAIFSLMSYIVEAKKRIIEKLRSAKGIGTFLRTEYGFKVTAPEGFVAIDHRGNVVKLVDRMEFSRSNFNAAKAWDQ